MLTEHLADIAAYCKVDADDEELPGFVDTHTHLTMSLMRGYARGQTIVLYVAVILLVILVQIIQSVGTRLSIRTDKRINK